MNDNSNDYIIHVKNTEELIQALKKDKALQIILHKENNKGMLALDRYGFLDEKGEPDLNSGKWRTPLFAPESIRQTVELHNFAVDFISAFEKTGELKSETKDNLYRQVFNTIKIGEIQNKRKVKIKSCPTCGIILKPFNDNTNKYKCSNCGTTMIRIFAEHLTQNINKSKECK